MKRKKAKANLEAASKKVWDAKEAWEKALEELPEHVLNAQEAGIGRPEIGTIIRYSDPRVGQFLASAKKKRYSK